METLTGGREIEVELEGGELQKLTVRQIPLRDYDRSFKSFDDEIEMVGIATNKTRADILKVSPQGFEVLVALVKEVNANGFFAFAKRRFDSVLEKMNKVNPEVLRLAAASGSKTSPPGLQPR